MKGVKLMKKAYQITEDGRKELEEELAALKGRRGEIAEKIAEATPGPGTARRRRAPARAGLKFLFQLCYLCRSFDFFHRTVRSFCKCHYENHGDGQKGIRSEEHTSELQSPC